MASYEAIEKGFLGQYDHNITQFPTQIETPTPRSPFAWSKRNLRYLCLASISLFAIAQGATTICGFFKFATVNAVDWKSCGDEFEGYQCAKVSLPLDYHNESDSRTVSIAVTRYLATNTTDRKGAVFINPGGPGGSGTSMAFTKGPDLSKVLKGHYDIIGFDPRGINLTRPYVSCFESQLDEQVFATTMNKFSLNLPVNVTTDVVSDLERQVSRAAAGISALSAKCAERVGDAMAYFGTEAVVRDIDALSKLIEGDNARINYWGFSYGTIIGQYMVKILPPERIGRVMIDGVVNPDVWVDYSPRSFEGYFIDLDNVLFSFAKSCASAGDACALSSLQAVDLISKVDETIESLYYNPVPILDLEVPTVVTAANLRKLVFLSMYNIQSWPQLADHLDNMFKGNFTGMANATMPKVDPSGTSKPDSSSYADHTIRCADAMPFTASQKPPTNAKIAGYILESLSKYSPRLGDRFFPWSFCHLWDGLSPRRSRYEGTFELEDGTLDTPILILSNTFDPVTPLINAVYAVDRLRDNARLIQQVDGWGHCTISQKSFCTAEIVSAYMLDGEVPNAKHTLCDVVEKPFVPFNESLMSQDVGADVELRKAWVKLSEGWNMLA